ncbi:MAG: type IX secretion system membrane protein PorP/SprF [Elusimicrobia bacterium]|nr:type IX secretion system membrane protein PorP/SprF [Elusimicrobiota bacterium]
MKPKTNVIILTLLFLSGYVSTGFAAFELLSFNARATGMADTFVALADDANTLAFNPAGLGVITMPQLSSQYTRLYVGLTDEDSKISDSSFSYLQPVKNIGAFGLGYFYRSLQSVYTENMINIGYGKKLSPRARAGVNVKLLGIKTNSSSSALSKSSANQLSLDAGILYFLDYVRFGFSLSDINQPDLALSSDNTNKLPFTIRTGASFDLSRCLVNAELTHRDKENRFGLGLESYFTDNRFGLRAGFLNGMGNRKFSNLTTGFSLRIINNLGLDYALIYPLKGLENTMSHRLSLSLKFGQEKQLDVPKPAKKIQKKKQNELEEPIEEMQEDNKAIDRYDSN